MQLTTQSPLIDHSTKYQLTDDHLYVLNYHVTTQSKLDEGRMKDSMRWSSIIKALRRLRRENKLEHVSRRCEELKEECGLDEGRMWYYLQEEMNEIYCLSYTGDRHDELGEVVFYYLVNNEEPDEPVQKMIRRLHEPLYDHTETNACFNWFELCAEVLQHEQIFSRFYQKLRLEYRSVDDVLIQILSKHPQLLFNKKSGGLIVRLSEHFSCFRSDEIIGNIRDKNRRTCLFYITGDVSKQVAAQCIQRVDTLDKLLSLWKTEGHFRLESLSDTYRDLIKHDMFKYTRIADRVKGIALEYIQKLFNFAWDNTFYDLWEGMIEHVLSNHNTYVNQMLASSTDKSGQTYMFRMRDHLLLAKFFINRVDDLYKLLISIRNTNGQTALRVNTVYVTELLADTYTPKHRDAFIELISITDENNTTALHSCYLDKLASLMSRVENNEYVMSSQWDANILIIYNTKDRPGAEEEAQTISVACGLKYSKINITIKKNKTRDKMIELIKQTANKETCAGRLPSYLIVILASHGNVGTIDDCDGKPVKLSEIEEAMCSDILDGKPKMLITQCCQIEEKSRDEPSYALAHDHFCAVMSCVSGQSSTRGVLLEKLSQKIATTGIDTNIFQLFQSVSREMEREGDEQIPIIMSTLKARLCPNDVWYESK